MFAGAPAGCCASSRACGRGRGDLELPARLELFEQLDDIVSVVEGQLARRELPHHHCKGWGKPKSPCKWGKKMNQSVQRGCPLLGVVSPSPFLPLPSFLPSSPPLPLPHSFRRFVLLGTHGNNRPRRRSDSPRLSLSVLSGTRGSSTDRHSCTRRTSASTFRRAESRGQSTRACLRNARGNAQTRGGEGRWVRER